MIRRRDSGSGKAQLHTLEGIAASVVVVLAVVYVLNSVVVAPGGSQTAAHGSEQKYQLASDVLTQAHSTGELKKAVLNWSERGFNETGERYYYYSQHPPGEFGETLENTLGEEGINYNIELIVGGGSNAERRLSYAYNGDPSSTAMVATQQVILSENDRLHGDGPKLGGSHTYPVPNVDTRSAIYNAVTVRMTVW